MKKRKIRAAVLIPTYNREAILKICLSNLAKSRGRRFFDIYVIDNGSTDQTRELVSSFKNIFYFREPKNLFISRAINNRFFNSHLSKKYDYVVILANDVLVESTTINNLITFMTRHPSVGVSGPTHYDWLINKRLNKGLLINPVTSLLANKVPLYIKSSINHFHSCFIVRTDVFQKVKGFNHVLYPMIFEEPDLGERILELNYRIEPCINAKIRHPIELSRTKQQGSNYTERENRLYNSAPKAYLFFRNRIIYMRLHTSTINFLIFYFVFNPAIFFYYLRTLDSVYLPYVFQGILDGTIFALTKSTDFISKQNKNILHV